VTMTVTMTINMTVTMTMQIFKPVEGSDTADETLVTVKGTPEQVDKVSDREFEFVPNLWMISHPLMTSGIAGLRCHQCGDE
jgi:hypothetical protein